MGTPKNALKIIPILMALELKLMSTIVYGYEQFQGF